MKKAYCKYFIVAKDIEEYLDYVDMKKLDPFTVFYVEDKPDEIAKARLDIFQNRQAGIMALLRFTHPILDTVA